MQRLSSSLQSLHLQSRLRSGVSTARRIKLSTASEIKQEEKDEINEKLVAAVLFERLPVILPKVHPAISTFREFSFQWQQQYRRQYPDEFLEKSIAKGKDDHRIDFVPSPRITDADKINDKRSLQRALDRRLYLLLHGTPYGASKEKPIWHFPEKLYTNEETMRKCAESALKSVIGGLSDVYFVGNAPCGHLVVKSTQSGNDIPPYLKQFFFKSQVIGSGKYTISKCDDYVWVTKDELLEYFEPEQRPFLQKMLLH
eukprot:Gb_35299 [translate_table: standard]